MFPLDLLSLVKAPIWALGISMLPLAAVIRRPFWFVSAVKFAILSPFSCRL